MVLLIITSISLAIAIESTKQIDNKIKFIPGAQGPRGEPGVVGRRGIWGDRRARPADFEKLLNRLSELQQELDEIQQSKLLKTFAETELKSYQTQLEQLKAEIALYTEIIEELIAKNPIPWQKQKHY